jgi:hypothetical protein
VTNEGGRLIQLELGIAQLQAQLQATLTRLATVEQQARQYQGMTYGWGGGGGGGQGFIGQATVAIGARTGATLAAGGQINAFQDVAGTLTAVGTSVIARCSVSRTTALGNGIDMGGWCWVEQDPFGTYWASPLDCT